MADKGESVGDLHLGAVVINVQDMRRAVGFWTAALGYVRRERNWDPEFMMLLGPFGSGQRADYRQMIEVTRRSLLTGRANPGRAGPDPAGRRHLGRHSRGSL